MTNRHDERVAAEVRATMARRRVRQGALAEALGISQAAVSRRLTGAVPFDVHELHVVAEVLGVPVTQLIDGHPITEGVG